MEDNKVAVLLEDLMAKFRTFKEDLHGFQEGIQQFRKETNQRFDKLDNKLDNHIIENRQVHQQIIQSIKELDTEVVQLKRVK